MPAKLKFVPRDFDDAVAFLRSRIRARLGHNTWLDRIDHDTVAIVLYRTPIVLIYRDGSVRIDTGGWNTRTTFARINDVLHAMGLEPLTVHANKPFYKGAKVRRSLVVKGAC